MTNQTQNKRDSFIFYRSFFEATKCLKIDEKAQFFDAICSYALDGEIGNLEGTAKGMFELVKPQLDANRKRFQNGCVKKQKGSKKEAKRKQTKSKTEANVNVNDNVNDLEKNNIKKEKFEPIAEKLKNVIEEKLNRKIQTKGWWEEIRKLIENDLKERSEPEQSVIVCIEAIKQHYGENYFPVVQSASAFREKFSKIEHFLKMRKPQQTGYNENKWSKYE